MFAMENFQAWLLNELDRRGWQPADIARKGRISKGTLSNILSGNRRPGPEVCRAIAKALSEPEEKVFRLAGLLSPLSASNDATLVEIQDIVKNLSPDQQKEVLRYIRYLYQNK